mmetsp:Transcript_56787/g.139369  ORF Transcript_56787/g.139369 Transcript_56787/m.139369 type:complete len:276 (-) Transcript_56787:1025-1852(-)
MRSSSNDWPYLSVPFRATGRTFLSTTGRSSSSFAYLRSSLISSHRSLACLTSFRCSLMRVTFVSKAHRSPLSSYVKGFGRNVAHSIALIMFSVPPVRPLRAVRACPTSLGRLLLCSRIISLSFTRCASNQVCALPALRSKASILSARFRLFSSSLSASLRPPCTRPLLPVSSQNMVPVLNISVANPPVASIHGGITSPSARMRWWTSCTGSWFVTALYSTASLLKTIAHASRRCSTLIFDHSSMAASTSSPPPLSSKAALSDSARMWRMAAASRT